MRVGAFGVGGGPADELAGGFVVFEAALDLLGHGVDVLEAADGVGKVPPRSLRCAVEGVILR